MFAERWQPTGKVILETLKFLSLLNMVVHKFSLFDTYGLKEKSEQTIKMKIMNFNCFLFWSTKIMLYSVLFDWLFAVIHIPSKIKVA